MSECPQLRAVALHALVQGVVAQVEGAVLEDVEAVVGVTQAGLPVED